MPLFTRSVTPSVCSQVRHCVDLVEVDLSWNRLCEFPEAVVGTDVSENTDVGYAWVWVADFDSRRLHEVVVELVVELMDHAVSHADDEAARNEFESQLHEFDVEAFVEAYRRERDFERGTDEPV